MLLLLLETARVAMVACFLFFEKMSGAVKSVMERARNIPVYCYTSDATYLHLCTSSLYKPFPNFDDNDSELW
jgi:hypothetical protein